MYYVERGRKYKNITTIYNGLSYHSAYEASVARDLDLRKKAKDIKSWERQVKIPLKVNGVTIGNYYIDFIIKHNDGTIEYLEAKGMETDLWRWKWKHLEAQLKNKRNVKMTVVKEKASWSWKDIRKKNRPTHPGRLTPGGNLVSQNGIK